MFFLMPFYFDRYKPWHFCRNVVLEMRWNLAHTSRIIQLKRLLEVTNKFESWVKNKIRKIILIMQSHTYMFFHYMGNTKDGKYDYVAIQVTSSHVASK